jgi:hypothetical protein
MYLYSPGCSNVSVVVRDSSAGIVTSVGTASWYGSVPVRCRSCTSGGPTIHSCSIGSSLRSVIVTGSPAGTSTASGTKREKRIAIVASAEASAPPPQALARSARRPAASGGNAPRGRIIKYLRGGCGRSVVQPRAQSE